VYDGLYDPRAGLSKSDAELIGAMTAKLLQPWDSWLHRRVEHLTFCDEDAVMRDVSIDFTLPDWFHDERSTPSDTSHRQLVPLGFLRKAVLVNFSLRDERGGSLPLLTAEQNSQVANATLTSVARVVLGTDVSIPVACDIWDLVRESPTAAAATYVHLLNARDSAHAQREQLKENSYFSDLARVFSESFLALTMLEVGRQERRIVHLSYQKLLWDRSGLLHQIRYMWGLVIGRPRLVYAVVPSVSEAASCHLELEAPDGLMITRRESYFILSNNDVVQRGDAPGGYRRAHFHFTNVAPSSKAAVVVHLRPRRSTTMRGATLVSLITLIATVMITIRLPHLRGSGNVAPALLLTATGILGLYVVRSGEDALATALLFPLRVLASVPVILGVVAGIVVVGHLNAHLTRVTLIVLSSLMTISIVLLLWNWVSIRLAARKFARKSAALAEDAESAYI
jgi:hypothetical protein